MTLLQRATLLKSSIFYRLLKERKSNQKLFQEKEGGIPVDVIPHPATIPHMKIQKWIFHCSVAVPAAGYSGVPAALSVEHPRFPSLTPGGLPSPTRINTPSNTPTRKK